MSPAPPPPEPNDAADAPVAARRHPLKRLALAILSVLVSGGLVAFLLWRMNWSRAGDVLRGARIGWLLLAAGVSCCLPLVTTCRWLGALRAHPDLQLPFGSALRAIMIANALNSVLPAKAGDIAKAVYLRRRGGLSRGLGTVLLERLVDLGVLGALGLAGYIASGARWGLWIGGGLLAGVCAVFAAILLVPIHALPLPHSIQTKVDALRSVFRLWIRRPPAIAQTLAASVAQWTLAGLTVCFLISALGVKASWGYAFSIFPLAILAGLVPATLSGIGTRDAAFVALLGAVMPGEEATLVALGYTLFGYWLLSLISLPFVGVEAARLLRGTKGT